MSKTAFITEEALIGRAILLRAFHHLREYTRQPLPGYCGLQQTRDGDHIARWIAAGKEYGYDACDDEFQEMVDCPYCSSVIAASQSRRILKRLKGAIDRQLTVRGNKLTKDWWKP